MPMPHNRACLQMVYYNTTCTQVVCNTACTQMVCSVMILRQLLQESQKRDFTPNKCSACPKENERSACWGCLEEVVAATASSHAHVRSTPIALPFVVGVKHI